MLLVRLGVEMLVAELLFVPLSSLPLEHHGPHCHHKHQAQIDEEGGGSSFAQRVVGVHLVQHQLVRVASEEHRHSL